MSNEEIKLVCVVLVGIAALLVLLMMISRLAVFMSEVSRETSFLKTAIRQADSSEEYRYWKNELKALRLSMIPGISRERAARVAHRRKK